MFQSVLDWRFAESVGEDPGLGCDILLLGECFPLFLRFVLPLKLQELLDIVSHPIRHENSCFISLTSPVLCSSNCKTLLTSFVKTRHINHFYLPYLQCIKEDCYQPYKNRAGKKYISEHLNGVSRCLYEMVCRQKRLKSRVNCRCAADSKSSCVLAVMPRHS